MEKEKDLEKRNILMEIYIKEVFMKEKKMEEDNIFLKMVQDMMEILKIINLMDLDR